MQAAVGEVLERDQSGVLQAWFPRKQTPVQSETGWPPHRTRAHNQCLKWSWGKTGTRKGRPMAVLSQKVPLTLQALLQAGSKLLPVETRGVAFGACV